MSKIENFLFTVFFLALFVPQAKAQLAPKTGSTLTSPNANYKETQMKIYSIFIYNFIKYIEWPGGNGDFSIGVVGEQDIVPKLEEVAKLKSRDNLKINIRTFSSVAEASPCNILFVPDVSASYLQPVINKFRDRPVLIVTTVESSGESGINFISIDGRPRFKINDPVVEARGLKVAGQLKALSVK